MVQRKKHRESTEPESRQTMDDLAAVQRKLFVVRTEWYNLGLELGQVLTEWLKGVNLPPTWQAMVNALKSPTVAQTPK